MLQMKDDVYIVAYRLARFVLSIPGVLVEDFL